MGNPNRACEWPNCACTNDICKFENPDHYIGLADAATRAVRLAKAAGDGLVLDTVYVIALPKGKGMFYSPPGRSASEAWINCTTFLAESLNAASMYNKNELRRKGCRARRVKVVLA
jgi:hypothetical protein